MALHDIHCTPHISLRLIVGEIIALFISFHFHFIIIIIIYKFLERHKNLGYRGAGGVSIRRTVGIRKS